MFDFLKPPTDNLYKFIALTGLLLAVVSVVLPSYALYALELQRLQSRKAVNIAKAEIESANLYKVLLGASEKSAEAAGKGADAARANLESARVSKGPDKAKRMEDAKNQLLKAMTQLQEESTELGKKTDEFHRQAVSIIRNTEESEYQVEVLETIGLAAFYSKFLLFAGVAVGLTLSVFGFILWYRKVQVFEDRVLKKAAIEILSEIQEQVAST